MTFDVMDRAPIAGPDQSSYRSLVYALFEPNLAILAAYLAINLYIATKALRDHAIDHPDTEGEGDDGTRPTKSDTRATELLVGISAWAFKNDARNAKRITAILAVASLVSTWNYMFAFLFHSYRAYIANCHLTSYPLPPAPPPLSWDQPDLIVPSLHLRLLRISQWLGSLSLFEQAWLEVVRDSNAWWWSSEICIITVGSWAVFLRSEAKRLRIPHVATFMLLGQLVAISFAFNLFQLAVIYRLDAQDLVPASPRAGTVKTTITIQPAEAPQRRELARSESELLMPPPMSPPSHSHGRSHAAGRASHSPAKTTATASTTVQRIPMAPRATLSVKAGALLSRLVPERIAMPLFLLGGLYSIFSGPDTLAKVLVMHAFPMLAVLYPLRRSTARKLKSSAAFGHPLATAGDKAAATRFVRSKRRVPFYLDPKLVHLALATSSVALRLGSVYRVVSGVRGDFDLPVPLPQRLWQSAQLVYPQTFHRHPAVSSIGSDHLAVLASVVAFILIESGLWLWKDAKTSPSARVPTSAAVAALRARSSEASAAGGSSTTLVAPTTVTLDRIDRSRLEFQSRCVLALVALAPVWGASASFGYYLALRETWIEDDEHFSQQQRAHARGSGSGAVLADEGDEAGASSVVAAESEKVTGRVVETAEGERVLEIRQRTVTVETIRGGGGEGADDGESSDGTASLSGAEAGSPTTGKRTRTKRTRASSSSSSRPARRVGAGGVGAA
ncbi:uncharacterized protein PSFLO_07549 [Pseudozyma flocculosa]|uniref:Uncharacterized protein n=1 Tax=Pseudozyma flocculosa TaxID=84751 RepID=A0A5C3FD32_9BASI|nr:uncharacterized protein PSFLO_07549 [Pseudozyma flocculosa]